MRHGKYLEKILRYSVVPCRFFASTSTGRPAGISGKFRGGGMGMVSRNSRWDVGDCIPPIFRNVIITDSTFQCLPPSCYDGMDLSFVCL